MRLLWTIVKLVIALVVVIPISIIVLAVTLGLFGAVVGLAFVALKLAVFGLLAYGLLRLVGRLLFSRASGSHPEAISELPPPDPHYEAAMRELDRELGGSAR
jgi:hypothetical protein